MSTVLVVDDNQGICSILEKFLSASGFEVIVATGGRQAQDVLASGAKVDVMVLDLKMPSVNGIEVIATLVSLGMQTSVIILSGSIGIGRHLEQLRQFGLTEQNILCKPVSLNLLTRVIRERLSCKCVQEHNE